MNIALYISNHGYGHLMRELPVAEELLNRGHRVLLVTSERLLVIAKRKMTERYPDGIDVGFFCRPIHEERVREIREQYDRPIVYLSVGGSNAGIDFPIAVGGLPYCFISTWGLQLEGENATVLPPDAEDTQDMVAAADFCITKAGWGSVAEKMVAGKRTALIEREGVPEDTYSISLLKERGEAISVTVEELKDPGGVLARLESMKPVSPHPNAYPRVADLITAD